MGTGSVNNFLECEKVVLVVGMGIGRTTGMGICNEHTGKK
jgi:hypothetical protein